MKPEHEQATRIATEWAALLAELAKVRAERDAAEARAERAFARLDLDFSERVRDARWPDVVAAERRVIAAAQAWRLAPSIGVDALIATHDLEAAVDALAAARGTGKVAGKVT